MSELPTANIPWRMLSGLADHLGSSRHARSGIRSLGDLLEWLDSSYR